MQTTVEAVTFNCNSRYTPINKGLINKGLINVNACCYNVCSTLNTIIIHTEVLAYVKTTLIYDENISKRRFD